MSIVSLSQIPLGGESWLPSLLIHSGSPGSRGRTLPEKKRAEEVTKPHSTKEEEEPGLFSVFLLRQEAPGIGQRTNNFAREGKG